MGFGCLIQIKIDWLIVWKLHQVCELPCKTKRALTVLVSLQPINATYSRDADQWTHRRHVTGFDRLQVSSHHVLRTNKPWDTKKLITRISIQTVVYHRWLSDIGSVSPAVCIRNMYLACRWHESHRILSHEVSAKDPWNQVAWFCP